MQHDTSAYYNGRYFILNRRGTNEYFINDVIRGKLNIQNGVSTYY